MKYCFCSFHLNPMIIHSKTYCPGLFLTLNFCCIFCRHLYNLFFSLIKMFITKFLWIAGLLLALFSFNAFASSSSVSRLPRNIRQEIEEMSPMERAAFMNKYKAIFLTSYFERINLCYKRFQRCSQILNPGFCATSANKSSFYIWARKIAGNILEESGTYCPRQLMMEFYRKSHQY